MKCYYIDITEGQFRLSSYDIKNKSYKTESYICPLHKAWEEAIRLARDKIKNTDILLDGTDIEVDISAMTAEDLLDAVVEEEAEDTLSAEGEGE